MIMSEDKECELFSTTRSSDNRKKSKKKKKKNTPSVTAAGKTAKELLSVRVSAETLSEPLLPSPHLDRTHLPNLEATCKNNEHCTGSGQKNKPTPLTTTTPRTCEKPVNELSIQDWESLRWEGVLQNPQEEAKRLELYRANRRQRYIEHRQARLKETQHTLR